MNTLAIIEKYYKKNAELYTILINHSTSVMDKSLDIAKKHPELNADTLFLEEAAMLHDIGIFMTNAPSIKCFGQHPYLCHGYLGRELLDEIRLFRHALVCERHTGVGLSADEIASKNLPLPHRDMKPISIEEKIICFADCFFSKTELGKEKSPDKVRNGLTKFGEESVKQFDEWCNRFL